MGQEDRFPSERVALPPMFGPEIKFPNPKQWVSQDLFLETLDEPVLDAGGDFVVTFLNHLKMAMPF